MKSRYNGQRGDTHLNSFLTLRIILSLAVVVSHVSGSARGHSELMIGYFSLGTLAVFGFFSISGYLVTPGLLRYGIKRYSVNRLVRIYPAYIFCTLITASLFLTIWRIQANQTNNSWSTPFIYILKNLALFPQSAGSSGSTWNLLGGLPVHGTNPAIVNASIWTLPLELMCYATLAFFLVFAQFINRYKTMEFYLFCFTVFWFFSIFLAIRIPGLSDRQDSQFMQLLTKWPYLFAFSVGVLTRLFYKTISTKVLFIALGLVVTVSVSNLILWALCGCAVFSFLLIQLGESDFFKRFSKFRDISYGLYLYHFPVIQILVGFEIFYHNIFLLFIVTFTLTGSFAYLSSRLIEVPAQLYVQQKLIKKNKL